MTRKLIIGDSVGNLTLIKFTEKRARQQRGLFRCVCGKEVDRVISSLIKLATPDRSCGCIKSVTSQYHIDQLNAEKMKGEGYGMANELLQKGW